MNQHDLPCAYEVDGRPVDAPAFIAVACDPGQSVVVEACAGSGKTWLLVARMLRLLLAGAEPAEMLAITFTRKAAQEMRERLMALLEEMAFATDDEIHSLLAERGVPPARMAEAIPAARNLYGRVLASVHPLSIDTFHSWFGRILKIAPLSGGMPHGCQLTETTGELLGEAYARFMHSLKESDHSEVREAMMTLYALVGDHQARQLLDAFADKRAEWWAATLGSEDGPLDALMQRCGDDGMKDARIELWQDEELCTRIRQIAALLGKGSATNRKRATAIETAMSSAPCIEAFLQVMYHFCDDSGKLRGNKHATGTLCQAIAQHFGVDGSSRFESECQAIVDALRKLASRAADLEVVALNRALYVAGNAYLEQYRQVKEERKVFDFADLEWHAYRLMQNHEAASFLQSRLDARYRHILLDEFQDTNPLQWSIVRAWLDAYGSSGEQPSVFIVGDPKQSIYRFRRAEPRVFKAARESLSACGARQLQTNQTRRNAPGIIDTLNACLVGNPIFRPQTTLSQADGRVIRLPLVAISGEDEKPAEQEGKEKRKPAARNPLTTPREEDEDARRRKEGALVAQVLHERCGQQDGQEGCVPWSEVMLLVRKRTHLSAYEAALREAGIPFVSSRRGGLLDSLEAADLTALLTFLATPADDLALAHCLKSPIFSADDDDLMLLAGYAEPDRQGWWAALQTAAREGCASPPLQRAHALLAGWLDRAPRLPVHDLLDLVLHQGELVPRYAQAAPEGMRTQVLGNIEAYVELALNEDAGRYPSLPKFLESLRLLKRHADSDAPDEAAVDAAVDAVRIMTIHSAKGLEAEIVVLLDANHSDPRQDTLGILCDWPEHASAPEHFSAFAGKARRGAARAELFEREEVFQDQEDWNLLYVAATRAKRLLIISGVADKRNGANADGLVSSSWYARLGSVDEWLPGELIVPRQASGVRATFELEWFNPPCLPPPPTSGPYATAAMEEGILLHALMERLTGQSAWPVRMPDAGAIALWLECSTDMARVVRDQAAALLSSPALQRFFDGRLHRAAFNEMEISTGQGWLRLDRAVLFDNEGWVLDYKRRLLDLEWEAYRAQLRGYREAASRIFQHLVWRAAVITADGDLHEID